MSAFSCISRQNPRKRLCRVFHGAATGFAITWLLSAGVAHGEVAVRLESGRTFSGEIGPATTAAGLALVMSAGDAHVTRGIRWDRVVAVEIDGRPTALSDFRKLAVAMATAPRETVAAPAGEFRRAGGAVLPAPQEVPGPQPDSTPPPCPPPPPAAMAPVVRSVAVDATLANWDADVEYDGLLVLIRPQDDWLTAAPVSGHVELTLLGSQQAPFSAVPYGRGFRRGVRLATWTRAFTAADVGPLGVALKLPFQALHPDFDLDAEPFGMVTARLVVPGSGVFAASSDVVIRRYSPLRTDLHRNEWRRFFPEEPTGRGKITLR